MLSCILQYALQLGSLQLLDMALQHDRCRTLLAYQLWYEYYQRHYHGGLHLMSGHDNDKAPERIRKLLGKPVRISKDSCPWTGTLSAYHEGPVVVISGCSYAGTGGGSLMEGTSVFPAGWHIEERQVPSPPEPCPHCGQVPWSFRMFGRLREVCGEIREDSRACLHSCPDRA
jgi:hypothetical protein